MSQRQAARSGSTALRDVRGYLFDVDGTLALADRHLSGYRLLPGARDLLALLRERGVPSAVFTNGTTKTPLQLSQALAAVGIEVDERHTLTPVSVAIDHFAKRGYRRILVLGVEGVWRPLVEAGFEVVRSPDRADDADAVLIGWHPDFGLGDVDAACRAVWGGAAHYTVSSAPFFASREGRTFGISGALAAAVRSVTGKRAIVLGKPSPRALACASARLGVPASQMAVVGDDPSLESVMALRGGAFSVGVHTGIGSAQDFDRLPPRSRPHLSIAGVDRLLAMVT